MTDGTALGAYLRKSREAAGLSLEVVSARSRIAPSVIRALEEGRADGLPAPVYVRGFIRAYCLEVGGDPDTALALYDAERAPPVTAPLAEAAPVIATVPRRRGRGRALIAGGVAAAVLVGAAGVTWMLTPREASPERDPRRLLSVGAGRVSPVPATVVASPEAQQPAAIPSPPPPAPRTGADPPGAAAPAPGERVLVMRAEEATWVRVRPGDARVSEEVLPPGAVREWRSPGSFTVTVGNAGGVRLELDGQALPALGDRGQVVRNVVIPGGRPEPGR